MIAALATLLVAAVIAATWLVAALVTSMSTLLNRMMTLSGNKTGRSRLGRWEKKVAA
jgi:hypothetical protein